MNNKLIELKQINYYTGDNKDNFPNLKIGEFGSYIQNNDNILVSGHRFYDARDFKIIFEINFPKYEVIVEKLNHYGLKVHRLLFGMKFHLIPKS